MKVLGYEIDKFQEEIVKDNSNALLVIAGAGSGKTLTIVAKIKYLVENKWINPKEIIAITFTNNASESLKQKLKKENLNNVESFTFHKLAMKILDNTNYSLTTDDILDNVVHEFFHIKILDYDEYMYMVLSYFNKNHFFNIKKNYLNFLYNNKTLFSSLEKLIVTFIHRFKCYNKQLNDFKNFLTQIKRQFNYFNYRKEKILLILILNIYIEYTDYLEENDELDFDDLIIKATDKLKIQKKYNPLKYIIIDEYQDISYIRLLLIKEIINITKSKIMVVGDDYQSIYGFSGCDVSLFWNFKKYFDNANVLQIKMTYRNSKELVDIANSFITKNKRQIKKEILSNKRLDNPLKIIYYLDIKKSLKSLLNKFIDGNILVLGRNNEDVYSILDNELIYKNDKIIYKNNLKLNITYMTVHKSKGLEEDNVIIINMKNSILGFPNKIKNNSILRVINNHNEKYPYAEERRLFYVAITRTKNNVYLLTPKYNFSIFIKDLK